MVARLFSVHRRPFERDDNECACYKPSCRELTGLINMCSASQCAAPSKGRISFPDWLGFLFFIQLQNRCPNKQWGKTSCNLSSFACRTCNRDLILVLDSQYSSLASRGRYVRVSSIPTRLPAAAGGKLGILQLFQFFFTSERQSDFERVCTSFAQAARRRSEMSRRKGAKRGFAAVYLVLGC